MSAAAVLARLRAAGFRVATAESCTGGLIGAALTDIPGASEVYERGFITYSNEAKTELLGVDPALIATHGAVSAPVAQAMAEGALTRSRADLALSATGVAGPGGTVAKPEGLVWFGLARKGADTLTLERRFGPLGRDKVRRESVAVALALLNNTPPP